MGLHVDEAVPVVQLSVPHVPKLDLGTRESVSVRIHYCVIHAPRPSFHSGHDIRFQFIMECALSFESSMVTRSVSEKISNRDRRHSHSLHELRLFTGCNIFASQFLCCIFRKNGVDETSRSPFVPTNACQSRENLQVPMKRIQVFPM